MMTSSGDLITLFVGLELLSISSYLLAGIRKKNTQSNESAMKYVINGSISTAITLFGMSYVYGLTGTTNIAGMRDVLLAMSDSQYVYLLVIAFLMIFVGLSFKITAAPFHMWAPDVYQGAPTPVTAFLSVVSKTAGFVTLDSHFSFHICQCRFKWSEFLLHFGDDARLYCFYCGSNHDHWEYHCIKTTQYKTNLCLLKYRSRGISFSRVRFLFKLYVG